MKLNLLFLFLLVALICIIAKKNKPSKSNINKKRNNKKDKKDSSKVEYSSIAVPRGKKSGGNIPGRNIFSRLMRETKALFCSELEGITLSLTKPTDTNMDGTSLDVLINCMDVEYDNPQFVVSVLAKGTLPAGDQELTVLDSYY